MHISPRSLITLVSGLTFTTNETLIQGMISFIPTPYRGEEYNHAYSIHAKGYRNNSAPSTSLHSSTKNGRCSSRNAMQA
ncbi:uncharacterized protein CC84DRAFT_755900 [Paraphaeosphaeria sporulosa]|uniref:Uncharacterized protein n=1 Tax=Paraphaeosphaeria sporulosa TaxID=1460663 RepID=A0A177CHL5_9PLEO|nr:uncharacterized protein CC84DRAFT_755900 [Paraphaeosphaeria sporulosa]OAG06247.1 hypothetical protein CC84DRAFT_755900 [Paraphaeosphaeria sporulosa]